jgi:hypothetical protein
MAQVESSEALTQLEQALNRIERRRVLLIHSLHDSRLKLNVSLPIASEDDGYQLTAYAPDLDIYGWGETEYEAIADLRQSIVDLYFDLKAEALGDDLQKIWDYLQSITTEQ